MNWFKRIEERKRKEFNNTYMVLNDYEQQDIEKVINSIADYLEFCGIMTTQGIFNYMKNIRFSEEYLKAVHSGVQRKLLERGKMLVAYPSINLVYSNHMNKVFDTYIYQAVPILVPDKGDEE